MYTWALTGQLALFPGSSFDDLLTATGVGAMATVIFAIVGYRKSMK